MLLVLSVSLTAKTSKAALLKNNLKQWEQFRWEGIIQVESSAFSMRKNFVMVKNKEEMRIDVLDSGVMGLQAKPLATIYVKDKIILEAPTIKQLAGVDPNWFVPKGAVANLINFTDSLLAKSEEIISKRKIEMASTSFVFDKKMRLSALKNQDVGMEILVNYNRRNQPTKVIIRHHDTKMAELQINEQKYDNIVIEPLLLGPETIEPATDLKDIIPEEGILFELDLDNLNFGELLDSLKLEDLNLSELLDSLKLEDLEKYGIKLDEKTLNQLREDLKLKDIRFKDLFKDIKPEDIKLEEIELKEFIRELLDKDINDY